MEYKDYYQILGLNRGASQQEVKRAYQKLARKYHPDVSKEVDAEHRFKEVNEAYHALKDPKKRQAYDDLGNQWQQGQDFKPPPGWEFHFSRQGAAPEGAEYGGFSDFFESIFGAGQPLHGFGRQQSSLQIRGQDLHTSIELQLEEAFTGTRRMLSLQVQEADPQGRLQQRTRQLNVQVPAGVVEGQRIRLAGQGGAGLNGGPPGDLFLQVRFAPHPHFQAKGRDIYLQLPVTPWEAALGAKVNIPTLAGPVTLSIPPGSQSGAKLRLPGRGLPGGSAGNQIVLLQIEAPPASTEAARALYRQMAETMPFDPRKARGL